MKTINYKNMKVELPAYENLQNLKKIYSYSTFSDLILDMCTESLKRGFVAIKGKKNDKGDIYKYIENQVGRAIGILQNQEKYYLKNLIVIEDKIDDLILKSKLKPNLKDNDLPLEKTVSLKDYNGLLMVKNAYEKESEDNRDRVFFLEEQISILKEKFKLKSSIFGSEKVYEALMSVEDFDKFFKL